MTTMQDRYRHRVEKRAPARGTVSGILAQSVCGKLWSPILWGQAARRYEKCPTCYGGRSRKQVAA